MTIKAFPWGMMQWVEEGHKGLGISFVKMTLRPGCETDLHVHDNAHEFIYIEDGEVIVEMIGVSKKNSELLQKKALVEGEKFSVQKGRGHRFINEGSSSAHLTLVYTHHARDYTKV